MEIYDLLVWYLRINILFDSVIYSFITKSDFNSLFYYIMKGLVLGLILTVALANQFTFLPAREQYL